MFYKNISYSDKTFYGITFKPGEIAEVPGYISDRHMIRVQQPSKKPTPTSVSTPAVTSKKEDKKPDGKKSSEKIESEQAESVSDEQ